MVGGLKIGVKGNRSLTASRRFGTTQTLYSAMGKLPSTNIDYSIGIILGDGEKQNLPYQIFILDKKY